MIENGRPKFDSLFKGEWPYPPARGVGVRFVGKPTNEPQFIEVLTGYGCPPDLAHRLLDDLRASGERSTTTLAHLNFDAIAEALKLAGVQTFIIPPQGYLSPS